MVAGLLIIGMAVIVATSSSSVVDVRKQSLASLYSGIVDTFTRDERESGTTEALVIFSMPVTAGRVQTKTMAILPYLFKKMDMLGVRINVNSIFRPQCSKMEIVQGLDGFFSVDLQTFESAFEKFVKAAYGISNDDIDMIASPHHGFFSNLQSGAHIQPETFVENCRVLLESLEAATDEKQQVFSSLFESLVSIMEELKRLQTRSPKNYLIVYCGPGEPGTGDWLCNGGETVSLKEILATRSRHGQQSKTLAIVHDGNYSGEWTANIRNQEEGLEANLILQTSCATSTFGEFIKFWCESQHYHAGRQFPEGLDIASFFMSKDKLNEAFWPKRLAHCTANGVMEFKEGILYLLGIDASPFSSDEPINPGSQGHPNDCKKPCKNCAARRMRCRDEVGCKYCHHPDHFQNVRKRTSQKSHFLLLKQWLEKSMRDVNMSPVLLLNLKRAYGVPQKARRLVEELPSPNGLSKFDVFNLACELLRVSGRFAHSKTPGFRPAPKYWYIKTETHENNVGYRLSWLKGVTHNLVKHLHSSNQLEAHNRILLFHFNRIRFIPVQVGMRLQILSRRRQSPSHLQLFGDILSVNALHYESIIESLQPSERFEDIKNMVRRIASLEGPQGSISREPRFVELVTVIQHLCSQRFAIEERELREPKNNDQMINQLFKSLSHSRVVPKGRLILIEKLANFFYQENNISTKGECLVDNLNMAIPMIPLNVEGLWHSFELVPRLVELYKMDLDEVEKDPVGDEAVVYALFGRIWGLLSQYDEAVETLCMRRVRGGDGAWNFDTGAAPQMHERIMANCGSLSDMETVLLSIIRQSPGPEKLMSDDGLWEKFFPAADNDLDDFDEDFKQCMSLFADCGDYDSEYESDSG